MTGTPPWLYWFFGVLMLVVAAYSLVLLVTSVATRRQPGLDVDVSHLLMGLSMAGMFEARWAFGARAVWVLLFAVLLTWFVVRSVQSLLRWGLHLSHFLIHAVMSFSMLSMYWFPVHASSGSRAMPSSTGSGLPLLLAVVLFASAIFTLASPNKGASHHGIHPPAYAVSRTSDSEATSGRFDEARTAAGGLEDLVATPWLEDASHAVECIAMGLMLILML